MVQFRLKVVLVAGLEPARSLERGILSPLRLPIPPQRLKPINYLISILKIKCLGEKPRHFFGGATRI